MEETDEVGTMDPAAGEAGIMDLEVGLGDGLVAGLVGEGVVGVWLG